MKMALDEDGNGKNVPEELFLRLIALDELADFCRDRSCTVLHRADKLKALDLPQADGRDTDSIREVIRETDE